MNGDICQNTDSLLKSSTKDILSDALFSAGAIYPFLRVPIENILLSEDSGITGIGTDGINIFYGPGCRPSEAETDHLLIHCIFRHVLTPPKTVNALWDLACDVSAEYLRAELFPDDSADKLRMRIRDVLPEHCDAGSAQEVYRALMDLFEDELDAISELFKKDDHRYWHSRSSIPVIDLPEGLTGESGGESSSSGIREENAETFFNEGTEKDYIEILEEAMNVFWPSEDEFHGGKSVTGEYGLSPGCREEKMLLRAKAKYDFSGYLKRFSTTREELRLNQAEFDFIPYCFGLERYGNMPLIEPLEYTESHKVEDLVIAIDTSGSCSLPVVERFLAEIEHILLQKENFFRRMNVHILQCDARIQSHEVIHSIDEWNRYTKDLSIKGRGGTDFTPVFALIDKMQRNGQLRSLKGLLYFTDGNGVYPQEESKYETAFVFTSREALNLSIPKWIIPLCLDIEPELLNIKKKA